MPVEKGQAGGGVEFLTRMMPVPLAKIPATQVVPQDVKARHANTTTALRNVFWLLRGRHRMDLLQTAYPTMREWKFCIGFYAREGFGTRSDFFSREAPHGNGTFKAYYVETRKSDQVPPAP
jgi:hypothetical protein